MRIIIINRIYNIKITNNEFADNNKNNNQKYFTHSAHSGEPIHNQILFHLYIIYDQLVSFQNVFHYYHLIVSLCQV